MEEGVLTLRMVPRDFKAGVLDGDQAPGGSIWPLDVYSQSSHPCDFTQLVNLPGARGGAEDAPGRRRYEARIDGRPTPVSPGLPSSLGPEALVVSHSARRLAKAVVLATQSPTDPRTLNAWGQQVGVSRGALRVWCNAAGVPARSCLDFLRVLRAVLLAKHQPWDLLSLLDVVDQRTLAQLLDRGGIRQLQRAPAPTVPEFIASQRFLDNRQLLQAIGALMDSQSSLAGRDA